jgi:SAM-dependent methyltransferase
MRKQIHRILSCLPESLRMRLARMRRPKALFFLLQGSYPISKSYGFDRGQPVDRYFIEGFLKENSRYIRGTCMEVMDSAYVEQFGHHVTRVDVLDIDPDNPKATIHGDLRRLEAVPDDTYDCFIVTQVFHYIDDVEAAVRETARILKPGGTALVTLPSLHEMEPERPHYWKFSASSARYLFGKYFPEGHLEIRSVGNVMTGIAAWVGLAREDLRTKQLERNDPAYASTVTVRATKPARPAPGETILGRSGARGSVDPAADGGQGGPESGQHYCEASSRDAGD